jgi:hypothetical protein
MSVDIIVTKRDSDYKASLADNSAVWEAGKSEAEAVGKLVMHTKSFLGITILRGKDESERDKGSYADIDAHFEASVTKNKFLLDHLPDGSH